MNPSDSTDPASPPPAAVRRQRRRAMSRMLRLTLSTALAWAALAPPTVARAAEHLSVTLTIHDYPPFIGPQLPYGGLLSRIVTEAFRLGDVDVKFTPVSSNRAITGVMMGLYDGGFGWAHAADRDRKLLYSDNSIYTFRMVFFQRRGEDHPWKTLADLAPLQIGSTLGDHYSDEFSALQENNKLHVQVAASDLNNMRKLLVGRIDLFPMEEEAGKLLIQSALTPTEQNLLSYQGVPISAVPTYLVLRRTLPRAQELIARFDRGYRLLLESGHLAKLMEETRKAILNSPMTFNSNTAP